MPRPIPSPAAAGRPHAEGYRSPALGAFFSQRLPGADLLWQVVDFAIAVAVITLLFAAIYKVLPDVTISWEDVWIGAAATALLFTIGKVLIGLYLGNASVGSTYGAAGSLLVVLVWVYYSAQILFFGAEFTQVYARRYGSRIVPDADAVPLTEEARAQQGLPHAAATAAAAAEPQPGREHRREAEGRRASSSGSPVIRGAAMVAAGILALLRTRSSRHEHQGAEASEPERPS